VIGSGEASNKNHDVGFSRHANGQVYGQGNAQEEHDLYLDHRTYKKEVSLPTQTFIEPTGCSVAVKAIELPMTFGKVEVDGDDDMRPWQIEDGPVFLKCDIAEPSLINDTMMPYIASFNPLTVKEVPFADTHLRRIDFKDPPFHDIVDCDPVRNLYTLELVDSENKPLVYNSAQININTGQPSTVKPIVHLIIVKDKRPPDEHTYTSCGTLY
jgi:hypothetical protein